jgi:hypothetical protein
MVWSLLGSNLVPSPLADSFKLDQDSSMSVSAIKSASVALCFTLHTIPASAMNVPRDIPVTATIATLRAIPVSAASQYRTIQVQDYYGAGSGCPTYYHWNAADGTADNGGAVINPSGNGGSGRWNLDVPRNGPLHSCVFGITPDSRANVGNGTDWSVQMQHLLDWASSNGSNRVHLDSIPGYCIRTTVMLRPHQGEIIEGDGQGNEGQIPSSTGSCINFTGVAPASGEYIFFIQTPYPGHGEIPYEAPKFHDFSMYYFSPDTNPGGCVGLNSIAGGFDDTNNTQQYVYHAEFENVFCNMRPKAGSQKIGFFCAKCIDSHASRGTSTAGGYSGFDIEGSENFTIQGPGTVSVTAGPAIILQAHNSFGNNDNIFNMQLLGALQGNTPDSDIKDCARESTISGNFFEDYNSNDLTTGLIHLCGGFVVTINGNAITAPRLYAPWIYADHNYNSITAIGNNNYGVGVPAVKFATGSGNYFLNSNAQQNLVHYGNSNGDSGWPFNSRLAIDEEFPPKVEAIYSPNYNGLLPAGYGLSEVPVNSTFNMPVNGSSTIGYLEFTYNRLPASVGIFDLSIHAWMSSGTGNIVCQLEDNRSLVGSPITQVITAKPAWYTLYFDQAILTSAGFRCWNPNARFVVEFNLAQIQDH